MYHQGLAAGFLGRDARPVSQPVMSMDHIKLVVHGNFHCHHRVMLHFLHQIGPVSPGKLILAPTVCRHIEHRTGLFQLLYLEILPQTHIGNQARFHLDIGQVLEKFLIYRVAQINLHIRGIDHPGHRGILVPMQFRCHENHLDPLGQQSLAHPVTGSPQTPCDMRRKFPAEH